MNTFNKHRSLMGAHEMAPKPSRNIYAGSSRGSTALVVEKDIRSRIALTALLERGRLAVVGAGSGQAALDTLDARDDVDIVLMDLMMPGMDGYEAITAIRTRPELVDLPIIAVTAKDSEGERERCLDAGATDYVPKPVEAATLLNAINDLLDVSG
jgi:CheY-like chemotaxis protein